MAMLSGIPEKYYRVLTDDYLMPNGDVWDGFEVRDAKKRAKDYQDAAAGYDPYNHMPIMEVTRAALKILHDKVNHNEIN